MREWHKSYCINSPFVSSACSIPIEGSPGPPARLKSSTDYHRLSGQSKAGPRVELQWGLKSEAARRCHNLSNTVPEQILLDRNTQPKTFGTFLVNLFDRLYIWRATRHVQLRSEVCVQPRRNPLFSRSNKILSSVLVQKMLSDDKTNVIAA